MTPPTSAASHYEILSADGTWLPLMLVRPEPQGPTDPAFPTIQEALEAAESEAPTSDRLATTVQETWIGGIGVEGTGYNVAPGVYTRTDGIAMAAGLVTPMQPPTGIGYTASPIVAFEEYLGHLYAAQEGLPAPSLYGGRVLRSAAGSGAWANTTFTTYATPYIAAGEYIRDLCLFGDGVTRTRYLYASSSDVNGLNGRLHRTSDGLNWTSTAAATFALTSDGVNRYGRGRMKAVHWTTQDGNTGSRLVTISGPNTISYTIPTADPFLAASWVEGVPIDTAYSLIDIAAARSHIWLSARDGLFDLNERGESPNLLSRGAMSPHGANGLAVEYLDGWVYQTVGDGALHRVWVGDGPQLQEYAGVCGPGRFTSARSDWLTGYATAEISLDGHIVPSLYNPITKRSAVFFGIDRAKVGVESHNPLAWYGPEFTLNADYRITRMWASTLAGDRRLWIAGQSAVGLQANVMWGSLPESGAPLDVLLSDGLHRYTTEVGSGIYNPYCRLESLSLTFGDKNALHVLNDLSFGTEGLDAINGTKLTVYQRADPAPRDTAWGTGRDVTASPTRTLAPTDTLEGHSLQYRVDFVNPAGGSVLSAASVGVLDAVRITRFDVVPVADRKVLTVEYGSGVTLIDGTAWEHLGVNPDTVTDGIKALGAAGRTTMRDPWDNRRSVKVAQAVEIAATVTERGDAKKHVRAQLRVTDLGASA